MEDNQITDNDKEDEINKYKFIINFPYTKDIHKNHSNYD